MVKIDVGMPNRIVLTLNPAGVADPAKRAILTSTQVVSTCLRLIATDDLSASKLQAGLISYQFNAPDLTDNEQRSLFQNWLLAKGFQDLARGVREMLEEAAFYLTMTEFNLGVTTADQVDAHIANARTTAQKLNFPQLLNRVNGSLGKPIMFISEYLSLQKVRNCLEHRNGLVAAQDVDPASGYLTLSFPRLQAFYMKGEEEVEVVPGEVIDTPETEYPSKTVDGIQIMIRRVARSCDYAIGERIHITEADFAEIAMACHLFADDLTSKLPIPSIPINDID